MSAFNSRMRDVGMQTRASALRLPEPLRTAEMAYLERRDAYLAVVADIAQKQEALAWAAAVGDAAYHGELSARLGVLGDSLRNAREVVRRGGEHAFGLAFRLGMREFLPAADVRRIEAVSGHLAGAPAVPLPAAPVPRDEPSLITHDSPEAWVREALRERSRLLSEHVRAKGERREAIAKRLRSIESETREVGVRLATAPNETVEIVVSTVARRMLAKDTLLRIEDRAEDILGRVKSEIVHKGGGTARADRSIDMRELAFLPPVRDLPAPLKRPEAVRGFRRPLPRLSLAGA